MPRSPKGRRGRKKRVTESNSFKLKEILLYNDYSMLSLFSYNILRGKRLEQICDWYKSIETNYDLICFQEFPKHKISYFMKTLPKDQYDYLFSPGFTFSPGISVREHIYGQLTVYNKEKLTLNNHRIISLGASRVEKHLFQNHLERSALLTQFTYENQPFIVVNCHLTPLTLNRRRLNQLDLITDQIRATDKALIIGDFNYPSVRQKGLISFMKEKKFENGATNIKTYKLFFIKQQLDYIFSKDCIIEEISVEDIRFSDHFPLVAQFSPL